MVEEGEGEGEWSGDLLDCTEVKMGVETGRSAEVEAEVEADVMAVVYT